MIIRIRTVYDDPCGSTARTWRARGRGRKLILFRDRSGARCYRNGDSLPKDPIRGDLLLHIDNIGRR